MDQYANCGTIVPKVCNLTKHEKPESNLDVFCDKGRAIPQTKFDLFLAFQSVWTLSGLFFALFGFLLKLSSCNPDSTSVFAVQTKGSQDKDDTLPAKAFKALFTRASRFIRYDRQS